MAQQTHQAPAGCRCLHGWDHYGGTVESLQRHFWMEFSYTAIFLWPFSLPSRSDPAFDCRDVSPCSISVLRYGPKERLVFTRRPGGCAGSEGSPSSLSAGCPHGIDI